MISKFIFKKVRTYVWSLYLLFRSQLNSEITVSYFKTSCQNSLNVSTSVKYLSRNWETRHSVVTVTLYVFAVSALYHAISSYLSSYPFSACHILISSKINLLYAIQSFPFFTCQLMFYNSLYSASCPYVPLGSCSVRAHHRDSKSPRSHLTAQSCHAWPRRQR